MDEMSTLQEYLASKYGPSSSSNAASGDFAASGDRDHARKKLKKKKKRSKKSKGNTASQRLTIHVDDADAIPEVGSGDEHVLDDEDRPVVVGMDTNEDGDGDY